MLEPYTRRRGSDAAVNNDVSGVILFGWSMGAAIALQLAAEPDLRGIVAGLVLESPVLDWVSTIKANCERSGLPAWTGALALPWLNLRPLARITGLVAPVALACFDWIARADELTVPTLILHGALDKSSPFELSTRLRALRPEIVDLEGFDADHTMSWNGSRAMARGRFLLAGMGGSVRLNGVCSWLTLV
jgi:pimeloyl-ACP methyl ester carboxylesterase